MDPDTTYKRILSFAFMVEELMRWLVADRHGMHALVGALDLSTLTRMHEQSVSAAGAAQAAQAETEERSTPWRADPRFAGDGYVLLDSHRVEPEDSRHDNAAALLAGLENPSPSTLPELVGAVCRRLRAPELRELKEVMLAWAGWRARQAGLRIEVEDMAEVNRMENPDDIEAFYRTRAQIWEEERRAEGRVEGREAGRAEGRVMGQRESLRRHAAMKFDAETAARLGAVLEGVTDQEALDGVLAALIECDTPSDLLARAAEARRRTNGRNAPADR